MRTDYDHHENAPKVNSIVPAASAVIIRNHMVLLQKRVDNNLWSLPGGKMEPGENIEQTIIREVLEETGYNVVVDKLIGVYTNPNCIIAYSDGEVRQQFSLCFQCSIVSGELQVSSESKEVRFFHLDEIETLSMSVQQKLRIDDCLKNQKEAFIR